MVPSFAILLLIWGGIAMLGFALLSRASQRALAGRVELLKGVPAAKPTNEPDETPDWRERSLAGVQSLFAFRMPRTWGVSASPLALLAAGIAAAVILWLLIRFTTHLSGTVAVLAAIVTFFLFPRLILEREQRRSDRQFSELLPDAIDMVVRIVRAGMPVGAAVRVVAQEANPPLNRVFARVADQAAIGMPFDEALSRIAAAIGNADFRFFAVAVSLQQVTGGNLAATLESLSEIIRRRRAVILKARAASAEVRMSAMVLGAIPVFVTGALMIVAPSYLNLLFIDRRGQVIFGLAVFLLVAAGVTMRTMIRNALSA